MVGNSCWQLRIIKALKHADGAISDAEYEPIKAERQELRDKINSLEQKMQNYNQNRGYRDERRS